MVQQKPGQCPNCKEFKLTRASTTMVILALSVAGMFGFLGLIFLIFFWPIGVLFLLISLTGLGFSIPAYFAGRKKAHCLNCQATFEVDDN